VDLVFETVGGDMFRTAVDNVAVKGRILVLGHVSGYLESSAKDDFLVQDLVPKLLFKLVSLLGFGAINHREHFHRHVDLLLKLIREGKREGKLKAGVDPVKFEGLEQIPDAVDYLFARKNIGKIVVKVA
jgi:NADPH-dependent curcumin reductase CurA